MTLVPGLRLARASHALAVYLLLTVAATWPLAAGLARDVAWDLGDSLLNMWILAWDCEQLLAMLGGDVSRAGSFFDANIFHPAPLALAYSEHLVPQALQVLPIYALTGNPILCYNLLFLSTFALSALGAYLLVRELTGDARAAFVAGLLFAFAPYRLAQSPHLQVLSVQWMPLALYGMRRYFVTRRLRPLLWSALALVVQGLSCGYYLLFFAPFFAAYALCEMAQRHLWRDARVWGHLAFAGAVAAALTAPFLFPYLLIRDMFLMTRSLSEVTAFSADVYSYATAFQEHWLWGDVIRAFPRAEGELFPGVVPLVLAVAGVGLALLPPVSQPVTADRTARRPFLGLGAWVLGSAALLHLVLGVTALIERRLVWDLGPFTLRVTDVTKVLARAAVASGLLLAISPAARIRTAALLRDRGFFLAGLAAAFWLSLGPAPQALGRPLDLAAPYRWLYEHVPGFEGLRAPARYGMIVALMLAVLGGFGAAALARWRSGRLAVAVMAALFLLEGTQVPFVVNRVSPVAGFVTPEARLYRPARAPRIYTDGVRRLDGAVLAELPLGMPDYDLRAVYYSTAHWRRILNGYSGFFPPHYAGLSVAAANVRRDPGLTIDAFRLLGGTHVVVHEGAYLGNEGQETSDALRTAGAVEVYRDGSEVIFQLPP